jgi:hypothetical protein
MKKKSTSQSAFFNLRVLIAFVFCLAGVFIALAGAGIYLGSSKAQAQPGPGSAAPAAVNSSGGPDVVRLVGPVFSKKDLRMLPYIPPAPQILKKVFMRFPQPDTGGSTGSQTSTFTQFRSLLERISRPVPTMPPPLLTFDGTNWKKGHDEGPDEGPPDTNGDVGPNHYVQAVNQAFQVFDKNGKTLSGPTDFDSFFADLKEKGIMPTPCGDREEDKTDPIVFYDQIADRWVITDAAGNGPPGKKFWECIGVSQTGDPVAGGWILYALQHDPNNPNRFGDYPKFGLWPDAYYLTMNEHTTRADASFVGVRVYALDRAKMIRGEPTDAVGFTIDKTGLGKSWSLVPASFRTGNPPPAGEREFLLAVDAVQGDTLTQVKGWLFHVDFVTPANSTLGLGANHAPNALITVNGFINAITIGSGGQQNHTLVPQPLTKQKLDTVGDRIMTPVVYQNRAGTESLWADHTIILNYPNGPTGIGWYQFDVTGGNFPASPVQQQDWTNGNDGLWRWMPSIAVDANGNMAIGYSVSSPSLFPGIRYAGRLASDPLNDLSQGEAIMTNGGGYQLPTSDKPKKNEGNRWGDYTMTTIDTADGLSFWHTNEYYKTPPPANQPTAKLHWFTAVGKFQFPSP